MIDIMIYTDELMEADRLINSPLSKLIELVLG
jgi:hypothetical protein